jgi:acetyl-CoA decarbonylase/synthase, CODH/ACS complex subunit gamma
MAKKLTGMEIFKLLPKTNCGECGIPTCMAFAMKLAQKTAELTACPYAGDEAKEKIGEAASPPIRLVQWASGISCGNELVMFRHDKTFVNRTVFACRIPSGLAAIELEARSAQAEKYCLERVGEKLRIEAVLIDDRGDGADAYCAAVAAVARFFKGGLILKSPDAGRLVAAAKVVADRRPLLHGITAENLAELGEPVRSLKCPVVVSAQSVDGLFLLAEKCAEAGLSDLVLDIPFSNAAALVQNNTIIRKSALGGIKHLGFPIITSVPGTSASCECIADASACICKYSSILVFDLLDDATILPLMMLRQNIYTDPQKPIMVEPGIYPINNPTPDSPLFVTTNFSLTYFIVSGEIEASGFGAHLAIADAEGMSVLTAWAAGKFGGEKIAKFLKEQKAGEKFRNRRVVIPGYVSVISGELAEQMPGWEVLVGPQEASDIGPYMKRFA